MTEQRIAQTSPHFTTQGSNSTSFRRAGFETKAVGATYLCSVTVAAFAAIIVRGGLSVTGGLIAVSAMIAATLLFYGTLSSVNRSVAGLAAAFNLAGLAVEVLRLQPHGPNIAVVFDGFFCILMGYLAFKSAHQERILSAFMVLGGLGWLTFLSSTLAKYLSPYHLAVGLLGEASVCLWLLLTSVGFGDPV